MNNGLQETELLINELAKETNHSGTIDNILALVPTSKIGNKSRSFFSNCVAFVISSIMYFFS